MYLHRLLVKGGRHSKNVPTVLLYSTAHNFIFHSNFCWLSQDESTIVKMICRQSFFLKLATNDWRINGLIFFYKLALSKHSYCTLPSWKTTMNCFLNAGFIKHYLLLIKVKSLQRSRTSNQNRKSAIKTKMRNTHIQNINS